MMYLIATKHDYALFKKMYEEAIKYGNSNPYGYIIEHFAFPDKTILNEFDSHTFWEEASDDLSLPESFLTKFAEQLSWKIICEHRKINERFVRKYDEYIDWDSLSYNRSLTYRFIIKHLDLLDIDSVLSAHSMPESFFWENRYRISWSSYMFNRHNVSFEFVKKFSKFIDLTDAAIDNPSISEKIMREFGDKLNWSAITKSCVIPEDIIVSRKDELDPYFIPMYQSLSEDLIRELKYYLRWDVVSREQKMSENFIREFHRYIDFEDLPKNKNIPEDVKERLIKEFAK